MTEIDVAKLRSLAENATPGPWEALGRVIEQTEYSAGKGEIVSCEVNCGSYCQGGTGKGVENPADAEFIAAANPATVLALLDRLEQAEAAIERVRTVHRKETRLHDWEVCTHCAVGMLQDPVDWPCDTIAALDTGKEKNDE